jgi:hypothetical protein
LQILHEDLSQDLRASPSSAFSFHNTLRISYGFHHTDFIESKTLSSSSFWYSWILISWCILFNMRGFICISYGFHHTDFIESKTFCRFEALTAQHCAMDLLVRLHFLLFMNLDMTYVEISWSILFNMRGLISISYGLHHSDFIESKTFCRFETLTAQYCAMDLLVRPQFLVFMNLDMTYIEISWSILFNMRGLISIWWISFLVYRIFPPSYIYLKRSIFRIEIPFLS